MKFSLPAFFSKKPKDNPEGFELPAGVMLAEDDGPDYGAMHPMAPPATGPATVSEPYQYSAEQAIPGMVPPPPAATPNPPADLNTLFEQNNLAMISQPPADPNAASGTLDQLYGQPQVPAYTDAYPAQPYGFTPDQYGPPAAPTQSYTPNQAAPGQPAVGGFSYAPQPQAQQTPQPAITDMTMYPATSTPQAAGPDLYGPPADPQFQNPNPPAYEAPAAQPQAPTAGYDFPAATPQTPAPEAYGPPMDLPQPDFNANYAPPAEPQAAPAMNVAPEYNPGPALESPGTHQNTPTAPAADLFAPPTTEPTAYPAQPAPDLHTSPGTEAVQAPVADWLNAPALEAQSPAATDWLQAPNMSDSGFDFGPVADPLTPAPLPEAAWLAPAQTPEPTPQPEAQAAPQAPARPKLDLDAMADTFEIAPAPQPRTFENPAPPQASQPASYEAPAAPAPQTRPVSQMADPEPASYELSSPAETGVPDAFYADAPLTPATDPFYADTANATDAFYGPADPAPTAQPTAENNLYIAPADDNGFNEAAFFSFDGQTTPSEATDGSVFMAAPSDACYGEFGEQAGGTFSAFGDADESYAPQAPQAEAYEAPSAQAESYTAPGLGNYTPEAYQPEPANTTETEAASYAFEAETFGGEAEDTGEDEGAFEAELTAPDLESYDLGHYADPDEETPVFSLDGDDTEAPAETFNPVYLAAPEMTPAKEGPELVVFDESEETMTFYTGTPDDATEPELLYFGDEETGNGEPQAYYHTEEPVAQAEPEILYYSEPAAPEPVKAKPFAQSPVSPATPAAKRPEPAAPKKQPPPRATARNYQPEPVDISHHNPSSYQTSMTEALDSFGQKVIREENRMLNKSINDLVNRYFAQQDEEAS